MIQSCTKVGKKNRLIRGAADRQHIAVMDILLV